MIIDLPPGITGVHQSLISIGTKASKRVGSKDTIESTTGDVIEQVSVSLPIYEYTKLFIYKEIKITWQGINDIFSGTFEENLEDRRLYVNIHKFGLYWVACRYLTFPCADLIHWIVSHTDLETMLLSSVSGTKLATFTAENFQEMYHLLQLVNEIAALFTHPSSSANSRDILKSWVRDSSKFRMGPK